MFRFLLVLGITVLASSAVRAQGVAYRLGIGHHTGESVGLDDGFTRFESWLPLAQPSSDSILFGDLRMLLYNDQTEADGANVGLGARWHDTIAKRIWGGYLYYDYRDTGHSHFNQLSWGVENLGTTWDWRVNAHLPVGETWYDFLNHATSTAFIGQHLHFTNIQQEIALRGVHGEVARVLTNKDWWQLRGAIGMYGYWHDGADLSAVGPRGRMELRVADQLWLSGYLQHDDEFQTTGGLTLVWRYGLTRHFNDCNSTRDLACRLGDPVERIQHIAVKRTTDGPGSVQVVRNAEGRAYTFHHVNSNAPDDGDGSIEAPTNTLAAASNQPEDIVLAHGGSEFVGELLTTNTENQRLLAEGVEHTIVTQQLGEILLPVVDSGPAPVIRDSPGNAITIAANGVEVSGFDVVTPELIYESNTVFKPNRYSTALPYQATDVIQLHLPDRANGIVANGVSHINVNRNSVTRASGSGLSFESLSGENRIANNRLTANLNGVEIRGDYRGDILGNDASENLQWGLSIHDKVVGNVVNNSANRNNTGMLLRGDLVGDLENNEASENFDGGIEIGGIQNTPLYFGPAASVFGDVFGNTANNNHGAGIYVSDRVAGDVVNNVADGNRGVSYSVGPAGGIVIDGDVGGAILGNSASENIEGHLIRRLTATTLRTRPLVIRHISHGIHVRGDVAGDVYGNIGSDNVGIGVLIEGAIGGHIKANVANTNYVVGLVASSVQGDISENVVIENGSDGIYVFESIGGGVIRNLSSGNKEKGIHVGGSVEGGILSNNVNDNVDIGIFIGGNVFGDFTANTTNGNDLDKFHSEFRPYGGVYVRGGVFGDLRDNQVENNWGAAVQVRGGVAGEVTGNRANGTIPAKFYGGYSGSIDGDGFTDDINENAQYGANGFDTIAPGMQPSLVLP